MIKPGQVWEVDLLGQYMDEYAIYVKIIIEDEYYPGYYQCVSSTGTTLYFTGHIIECGRLLDD